MAIHFEELWEKCENLQKEASAGREVGNVIDELIIKLNLYKALDAKTEIPEEDRQKVKSRMLGEVILTLTALSVKDNVNVYEALNIALQYRSVEHFNTKHPTT